MCCRLCQNPANSKDGRKAPEVVFDRDSFYVWNVPIAKGDLGYVMNENDKYFVEVTDLIGKEKRHKCNGFDFKNLTSPDSCEYIQYSEQF